MYAEKKYIEVAVLILRLAQERREGRLISTPFLRDTQKGKGVPTSVPGSCEGEKGRRVPSYRVSQRQGRRQILYGRE